MTRNPIAERQQLFPVACLIRCIPISFFDLSFCGIVMFRLNIHLANFLFYWEPLLRVPPRRALCQRPAVVFMVTSGNLLCCCLHCCQLFVLFVRFH